MPFSNTFEHDQQFMRLVRRETDVDLITAALEIARDGQANLDFAPTRLRLQRSIARLTHPVTQAGSDLEELKMLVRHMTEELNLHGDDDCHGDPEASYLNRVLETGRGIPISLSLIFRSPRIGSPPPGIHGGICRFPVYSLMSLAHRRACL